MAVGAGAAGRLIHDLEPVVFDDGVAEEPMAGLVEGLARGLAVAAGGGVLAYLLLNALVQVTSFPVIAVSTFAPIYPLLLVFVIAALWDAAEAWTAPARTAPPA